MVTCARFLVACFFLQCTVSLANDLLTATVVQRAVVSRAAIGHSELEQKLTACQYNENKDKSVVVFGGCTESEGLRYPCLWFKDLSTLFSPASPSFASIDLPRPVVLSDTSVKVCQILSVGDSFLVGSVGDRCEVMRLTNEGRVLWRDLFGPSCCRVGVSTFGDAFYACHSAVSQSRLETQAGNHGFTFPNGMYVVKRYSESGNVVWSRDVSGGPGLHHTSICSTSQHVLVTECERGEYLEVRPSLRIFRASDGNEISHTLLNEHGSSLITVSNGDRAYVIWRGKDGTIMRPVPADGDLGKPVDLYSSLVYSARAQNDGLLTVGSNVGLKGAFVIERFDIDGRKQMYKMVFPAYGVVSCDILSYSDDMCRLYVRYIDLEGKSKRSEILDVACPSKCK